MDSLKERFVSNINIQNTLLFLATVYSFISPTWQAVCLTLILASYNGFRAYLVMRDTQGIGKILGTKIKELDTEIQALKSKENLSQTKLPNFQGLPQRLF